MITPPTRTACTPRHTTLWLAALIATLTAQMPLPAIAESPTNLATREQAATILTSADAARDARNTARAEQLYTQALTAYSALAASATDLDADMIRFRQSYCQNQLQALRRLEEPDPLPPEPDNMIPDPAATPPPITQITVPPPQLARAATVLLRAGEWQAAASLADLPGSVSTSNHTPLVIKAIALAGQSQFQEANTAATAARALAPNNPDTLSTLAMTQFCLGHIPQSRDLLQQALKIDPDSASIHYNLARVLITPPLSNKPAARTHYLKALKLGGKPDPALETATTSTPTQPTALD